MKGKNTGSSELAREYDEFMGRMELEVVNGVRSFVGRMLDECKEECERRKEYRESGRIFCLSLEERMAWYREESLISGSISGLDELYEALHQGYLGVRGMFGLSMREYERQKEEIEREGLKWITDKGVHVSWRKDICENQSVIFRWLMGRYKEILNEIFRTEEDYTIFEAGLYKLYEEVGDIPEWVSKDDLKSCNSEELLEAEMKRRIEDIGEEVEIGGHRVVYCSFLECMVKRRDEFYPFSAYLGDMEALHVMIVLLRGMIKEGKRWPMDIVEEGKEKPQMDGKTAAARLVDDLGTFGNMVLCRAVEGGFVQYGSDGVLKWLDEKGQACETATPDWGFFCWKMMYVAPVSKQKLCEAFGRPNNKILLMEKGNKARWVKNDLTAREVEITKLFEK